MDIDEIMEVAGLDRGVRDWVLDGRSSGDCSMNVELPGKLNARGRSWLQLRDKNGREYMLDRLTQVPGYMFVTKMREMRNERDMRDWTDAISHLNPMMVVLDVEIECDENWDEREMWVERLVNEHIADGRQVVLIGRRQDERPIWKIWIPPDIKWEMDTNSE